MKYALKKNKILIHARKQIHIKSILSKKVRHLEAHVV
jgi:hypothetical protein